MNASTSTKLIVPRPPEFKSATFQVKATDDQRYIIEGILNAIGNIDDGDDRTLPGAFKKTLNDSYARKSAQHLDFLYPYLWNHDPNEPPIGGIFDGDEVKAQGDDPAGLYVKVQLIPDIERAREVYSCFKSQREGNTGSSGLLRQSMGYKAIRYEYVPEKVDGQTRQVRNLLEVQLWEGSAVVFPMNELSVVTNVKSNSNKLDKRYFIMPATKTVCGDTSLPIGPRDESWDGNEAEKQIFSYAEKEDGTIDAGKAKKCFLQIDGDDSLKGSYHYPFCNIVDGSPQINVGGVKACAGALAGGRGASTEGEDIAGMRAKVDTMYTRINKKYPNDSELSGTWNEKDKASKKPMQRKTFEEHYNEEQAEDLLEDWQDVLLCSLTCAVLDACKIGDTIESDVSDALTAFNKAVMDWVKLAQQYNLSQYLTDNSYSSADYTMQNGSSNSWGYMSRRDKPARKAGARFSGDTKEQLQQHADDLKGMAADHKTLSDQLAAQYKTMTKAMKDHADALEKKASDLTDLWRTEGQGPAYADDPEDKDDKTSRTQYAQKSRREPPTQALTHDPNTQPGTLTEDEELKALEAALASNWNRK